MAVVLPLVVERFLAFWKSMHKEVALSATTVIEYNNATRIKCKHRFNTVRSVCCHCHPSFVSLVLFFKNAACIAISACPSTLVH